jgi:hypothetical protein
MKSPFRYFNSSPEVICLVVMMYLKYPLSLRNVEDLLSNADPAAALHPIRPEAGVEHPQPQRKRRPGPT